jgi:PAS domain S-box-containing protein
MRKGVAVSDCGADNKGSRLRWAIVLGGSALLGAWLLVRPSGDFAAKLASIAGNIIGPALGVWWWAVRRRSGSHGRHPDGAGRPWDRQDWSWLLLGLSQFAFLFGQVIYYFRELVLGVAPFPSTADVFFFVAYPFQMAAVLLLPARQPSKLRTAKLTVDAFTTIAALGTFSWFFLLGPMIASAQTRPLAAALVASYPVMDLLVLLCLLMLLPRGGSGARPGVPAIALGMLALVIADTFYAYQNMQGTYATGRAFDFIWPLGYMLIGLGARSLRLATTSTAVDDSSAESNVTPPPFWATLLPYMLIPLVVGLLVYTQTTTKDGDSRLQLLGVEVGAGLIVLLIVFRQVLSIADNARLNRQLHHALTDRQAAHESLAQAHQTLRDSEQRFRIAAQSAGDLIYEWNVESNRLDWFGDIDASLGYGPGEFPRTLQAWESAIHRDDFNNVRVALYRHLAGLAPFDIEYRVVTKEGRTLTWVERGKAIRDETGKAVRMIGAVGDITTRKAAEQRLRYESRHDALTGLPNRTMFSDQLSECVRRARRMGENYHYAVLFLDLDRFKVINDSLGHAAGDRLLIEVARRLRMCLRDVDAVSRGSIASATDGQASEDNDPVARLGGDEFTILLDALAQPADALRVAERIQAALSKPINFDGHEVVTSASIGIINGTSAYVEAKNLLRDADAAMYRAKQAGRARHAVFDTTMHDAAVARLRIESDLRGAVTRGEMILHYQPIVCLRTGRLAGFEALVRWPRDGQLISPADFIPIAEDTGLIVPLGAWVIGEACRQLAAWHEAHLGCSNLTMSVNLSRKQLADSNLIEHCRHALVDNQLDARLLKLEITESAIMDDRSGGAATLRAIKALGIQLHIDDFGTGYSSLSCLQEYALDGLKIDRAFAFNPDRRDNAAIVNAIITLAHTLGMEVIAEGIETPAQLEMLNSLNCGLGQGYLFSRPLNAAAAEEYLRNHTQASELRLSA